MERINQSPNAFTITPSDTTVYNPALVGIRADVAGNITIFTGGQSVVIAIAAKETIFCSINKVMNTGTTATGLTGFQWPE
jgi:hypothetical protein